MLEAQLVAVADEIAYDNHDLDDGLRSRLISEDEIQTVALWKRAARAVEKRFSALDERTARAQTLRFLIDMQVTDVISATERAIEEKGVRSPDDARTARLVGHTQEMSEMKKELERFLLERFYRHRRVMRMAYKAKRLIERLFGAYVAHPELLPADFQAGAGNNPERTACDYVAGMTDRFAQDEYRRLFEPFGRI